jgi:hypothetical protein
MATQKTKRNLIEDLTNELIEIGVNNNTKQYANFIGKLISRAINVDNDKTSAQDIRKALESIKIPAREYLRQIYNMLLLSDITAVIEDQKITKEEREEYAPALLLLATYPVSKPKILARKINRITNASIKNNPLSGKDELIRKQTGRYFDRNKKLIKKLLKENSKNLLDIQKQIKSNVSKVISKNLKREINKKIIETVRIDGKLTELKRHQTAAEIRTNMRNKFGDQVDYRVRRIVDTEMHDLAENIKMVKHLQQGYTHKKWNTEQDSKVRPTHRKVQGKVIPVNQKFKVGRSKGMYPGDPQLSPKERIFCRCFLTYTRR